MAVKEQNRFSIGRIGVAPASRAGQIVGDSIARNAMNIVKTIEPLAKEQAIRRGQEEAASVETNLITGIDPSTGLPKAYRSDNFQIDNQIYNDIIKDRFQDEIIKEIKIAAADADAQTINSDNRLQAFSTKLNTRLEKMSEHSVGWAKQFIESNGADYLAQTSKAIQRQVASQARAKLKEDSLESISEKLVTVNTLSTIGKFDAANTLQGELIAEIDNLRSQNIINKDESELFKTNVRLAPITYKFRNQLYSVEAIEPVFERVQNDEISLNNFILYKDSLSYAFSSKPAFAYVVNQFKKTDGLKEYGKQLEILGKDLKTDKDFKLFAKISKNVFDQATQNINFRFGREAIQIEAEIQSRSRLQSFVSDIIEKGEIFDRETSFTSDNINKVITGNGIGITNTFVDTSKNNAIGNILTAKLDSSLSGILASGKGTKEIIDETIKFITTNISSIRDVELEDARPFMEYLKTKGFNDEEALDIYERNIFPLKYTLASYEENQTLVKMGYRNANVPKYTLYSQLASDTKNRLGQQKQISDKTKSLLQLQRKVTNAYPIGDTPDNRKDLTELTLLQLNVENILPENATEEDLVQIYLNQNSFELIGKQIELLNSRQMPPNSAIIRIFQDLADGKLSGNQLKNAADIYSAVREKTTSDSLIINRFAINNDGIDGDTYSTLEALHVFKQAYEKTGEDYLQKFEEYTASFTNPEISNTLAVKLNIPSGNIEKVNKGLDSLVEQFIVEEYSQTNIGLMTKVMSARARALLLTKGNRVKDFDSIKPDIKRFIEKEFPPNLGVVFDNTLRVIDMNNRQSPTAHFGDIREAKRALSRIENEFQTPSYKKYFDKYHNGIVPTFDINREKEKELTKGFFSNIIADGITVAAAQTVNSLTGLISDEGLIDMQKAYGLNLLDLFGLEDKEEIFGSKLMLVPVGIDGKNSSYRIMVQDFKGSSPYFLPKVNEDGTPDMQNNNIIYKNINLNDFGDTQDETTPSLYETFIQKLNIKQKTIDTDTEQLIGIRAN